MWELLLEPSLSGIEEGEKHTWVISKVTEGFVDYVTEKLRLWEKVELQWDKLGWLAGIAQTRVEQLLFAWAEVESRVQKALDLTKECNLALKTLTYWNSIRLIIQSPKALLKKMRGSEALYLKYDSLQEKWWTKLWLSPVLRSVYEKFAQEYLFKIVDNPSDYWAYHLFIWSSPHTITDLLDVPWDKCMTFVTIVSEVFDEKVANDLPELSNARWNVLNQYAIQLYNNDLLPRMMN